MPTPGAALQARGVLAGGGEARAGGRSSGGGRSPMQSVGCRQADTGLPSPRVQLLFRESAENSLPRPMPEAPPPPGTTPSRPYGRRGSPAAPIPEPRGCPRSLQTVRTRQPLPSFPNPCPKPRGESAGSTCGDGDEDRGDAGRAAHLSSSRRPGSATTY